MNFIVAFLFCGTFVSAAFAAMFASNGQLRYGMACLSFVMIFLIGLVVEHMGPTSYGLVPMVAILMLFIWGTASGFGLGRD